MRRTEKLLVWNVLYAQVMYARGAIHPAPTEIDARDHRAWYGMGQAYELLHMYNYAVHYYSKACALRCVARRPVVRCAELKWLPSNAGRMTGVCGRLWATHTSA